MNPADFVATRRENAVLLRTLNADLAYAVRPPSRSRQGAWRWVGRLWAVLLGELCLNHFINPDLLRTAVLALVSKPQLRKSWMMVAMSSQPIVRKQARPVLWNMGMLGTEPAVSFLRANFGTEDEKLKAACVVVEAALRELDRTSEDGARVSVEVRGLAVMVLAKRQDRPPISPTLYEAIESARAR